MSRLTDDEARVFVARAIAESDGSTAIPWDELSSWWRVNYARMADAALVALVTLDTRKADALSDPTANTTGAHHANGSDTERAAAYAVMPKTGSQRSRVLSSIYVAGEHGRTDEEMEIALTLRRPSAGNRRGELAAGGWVRDSGLRRPTRSGNSAIVWVLTDAGRARLDGGECPAGGPHTWETLTDWEAGPAEKGGTRCAECGKTPDAEQRAEIDEANAEPKIAAIEWERGR